MKLVKKENKMSSSIVQVNMNLYDLNNDCLIKIFQKCNIETLLTITDTCQRFKAIVRNFVFPRWHHLDVSTFPSDENLSYRIIKNIGPHLKILWIKDILYRGDEIILRLLGELTKWTGDLDTLYIGDLPHSGDILVPPLRPLFSRTKTLICNPGYFPRDFYPPLSKLKHLQAPFMSLWKINIEMIHSLESFATYPTIDEDAFTSLFEKNPQLKRFKASYILETNLEDITKHKNLEELVLSITHVKNFSSLKRLKNLEKLRISVYSGSDEMLVNFPSLTNLRVLRISLDDHFGDTSISSYFVISIARNNKNLEQFSINNVSLDETVILNFIKFAANLRALHVHRSGIEFKFEMLHQIAELREECGRHQMLKFFSEDDNPPDVSEKLYLKIY